MANSPDDLLTIRRGDWERIKAHVISSAEAMRAAADELKQLRASVSFLQKQVAKHGTYQAAAIRTAAQDQIRKSSVVSFAEYRDARKS